MGVDMVATVTARIAKKCGVFGWNISDTSPWRNSSAYSGANTALSLASRLGTFRFF